MSIELSLFTQAGEPVQVLSNPVMIGPPLEGSRISNFELERVNNLIGAVDFLKFYVPPLRVTVFTETNLVLEIPNGIAYYIGDQMVCTRKLSNGEKAQLECEGVEFSDGLGGLVLRSVRIHSLCGQYHVCFEDEPIIFEVQVRNPSTNERPDFYSLTKVKLILRQESGLDLGSGQRFVDLPPMLSNVASVTMAPLKSREGDECHKTGATCHLIITVRTSNTLKSETSGAYLEIKLPEELRILGDQCWARVQTTLQLNCYLMSKDTLNVRAPASLVDEIIEAGNEISVIIEDVRMPISTASIRNPVVSNMELLPNKNGSRVFSLVDTNLADPGFTQLSTAANSFKSADVLR